PEVARRFADPDADDGRYVLWFHHLPWGQHLASGRTVWDELTYRYERGVRTVAAMRRSWSTLAADIDAERVGKTRAFLDEQQSEAQVWRDACIAYFQSLSGL